MKYQELTAGFVQVQGHTKSIIHAVSSLLGLKWEAVAFALFATNPTIHFDKDGEPCLRAKDVRTLIASILSQNTALQTIAVLPLSLNHLNAKHLRTLTNAQASQARAMKRAIKTAANRPVFLN